MLYEVITTLISLNISKLALTHAQFSLSFSGQFQVVGYQNDGNTMIFVYIFKKVHNFSFRILVQIACRLIGQNDIRLV